MATALAENRRGKSWHTRGTWNARDDRKAFVVWLGLLWAGLIAGFGVDFPRYLSEVPPAPRIVPVHAVVFTVWMLILTVQVLLVVKNHVSWHMRVGWFAAGWACLIAILGPWAAMDSQVVHLSSPAIPPQFISVHIADMAGFLVLLAWGLTLRRNPAVHKRLMILATVPLAADPGFSRFSGWLWPTEPTSHVVWFFWMFYGNVLLIALMLAWDWWRGRMMQQVVIGGAALLASECLATILYFWGPWKALTLGWVEAWARYVS